MNEFPAFKILIDQGNREIISISFGEMSVLVLSLFTIILYPSPALTRSCKPLWGVDFCRLCFPGSRDSGPGLGQPRRDAGR